MLCQYSYNLGNITPKSYFLLFFVEKQELKVSNENTVWQFVLVAQTNYMDANFVILSVEIKSVTFALTF